MAVYDIFSNRQKANSSKSDDVYIYDVASKKIRSQIGQMYKEAYSNFGMNRSQGNYFILNDRDLELFVDILRREHGLDHLDGYSSSRLNELSNFIKNCEVDQFLDCVEILGKSAAIKDYLDKEVKDSIILEINHRLREAGMGYEFVDREILRIDSRVLHAEVLKPTLSIISSQPEYQGAEEEIRLAFQKYRTGDNKGAVVEALKAFESTMKAILARRGWSHNPTDPASKLIAACLQNGLIPSYMQTYLSGLRSVLESGVPTVRNKTSGHGQGTTVQPLDDHYASYVLYTALANMKLLIDCEKALP